MALKFLCPGLFITSPDHLVVYVGTGRREMLRIRLGLKFQGELIIAVIRCCLVISPSHEKKENRPNRERERVIRCAGVWFFSVF